MVSVLPALSEATGIAVPVALGATVVVRVGTDRSGVTASVSVAVTGGGMPWDTSTGESLAVRP